MRIGGSESIESLQLNLNRSQINQFLNSFHLIFNNKWFNSILKNCKTRTNRKDLQKKLKKKYDVKTWSNIADLLRVQNFNIKDVINLSQIDTFGIDEEEASKLEKVGVDTVKELARRNPVNLHKKLFEYWDECVKVEGSEPPTLDEVTKWIS